MRYRISDLMNRHSERRKVMYIASSGVAEAETACQKWGGGLGVHEVEDYIHSF